MFGAGRPGGRPVVAFAPMPIRDTVFCLTKIVGASTGIVAVEKTWNERRWLLSGVESPVIKNIAKMLDEAQVSTIDDNCNGTFAYISGHHEIPSGVATVSDLCNYARSHKEGLAYLVDNQYAFFSELADSEMRRFVGYFLLSHWASRMSHSPTLSRPTWKVIRSGMRAHGWTVLSHKFDYRANYVALELCSGVDDMMFGGLWPKLPPIGETRIVLHSSDGILHLSEGRKRNSVEQR